MILKRDLLRAVLPAVDKTDNHFYANKVQVQPDGRAVATNGHVLLVASDRYPFKDEDFPSKDLPAFQGNPPEPITIEAALVERVIAAMPKKTPIDILKAAQLSTNGTPGGAVLSATDLQVPCTIHVPPASEQGGSYPSWPRLLPRDDRPSLRVAFSTDVLEALIKSAKAITTGKTLHGPTIVFELPTEPQHQGQTPEKMPDGCVIDTIGVRFAGDDVEVRGVAMPMGGIPDRLKGAR